MSVPYPATHPPGCGAQGSAVYRVYKADFLHKAKPCEGHPFHTVPTITVEVLLELPVGKDGIGLVGGILERENIVIFFIRKKEEKGAVTPEEGMKEDVGPRGTQYSFQSVKYTRRYAFPSKRSGVGLGSGKEKQFPVFFTDDP